MPEMPDGRLIVAGSRRDGIDRQPLNDPYRSELVAEIHVASPAIVAEAVERGREGAREVALMPAHARADVLRRAADIVRERADLIATTVSRQTGKALKDTRREADRST